MSRTVLLAAALALTSLSSASAATPIHIARTGRATPHVWPLRAPFAPTSPSCSTSTACSTLDVQYFGGRVIGNAKVYAVYWSSQVDPAVSGSLGAFYAAVTNHAYLDWVNEYNTNISIQAGPAAGTQGSQQVVGRGVFAGDIQITPNNSSTSLTDTDITAELDLQIDAGHLPPPDADTLYMVHFPAGTSIALGTSKSCVDFCAFHSTWQRGGASTYFGVIPDHSADGCQAGCGMGTVLENTTASASHELVEAITDAEVGLANNNAPPLGWYDSQTNSQGEVGDMCAHTDTIADVNSPGTSWTVQQIYSRLAPKPNQCVTTRFDAKDFSVSLLPNTGTLAAGKSLTVPLRLATTAGTASSLTLSVTGLPSGVTAAFNSTSTTSGSTGVTLTLTAAAGAAATQDALVVVRATGAKAHSAAFLLQVTAGTAAADDFSLSIPAGPAVLLPGVTTTVTVSTSVVSGAAQAISLTDPPLASLPLGVVGHFSPTTVTAGQSSTLSFTVLGSVAPATGVSYTVSGTAASGTHTATGTLQVDGKPTVSLTAPASGATLSGTVTVGATATAGAGTTLKSLILKLDGAQLYATATSPLSYAWDTTITPLGAHTLTVTATDNDSGGATASANVTVVAPAANEFGLALAPSTATLKAGGAAASFTVTTQRVSGNAESLALTASGLPPGVTAAFSPLSVTAGASSTLTLTAPLGTAHAAATAFSVKATSASVPAGHAASGTVNVIAAPTVALSAPISGTVSGSINVSAAATVDSGATLASLTLFDGAAQLATGTTATKTITWDTTTVANGNHTISAKVTDSNGLTATSAGVVITVANGTSAGDFTLALAPAASSVSPGGQTTYTVTTTSVGTPASVTLSVAGLPAGVTGTFTPTTVTSGSPSTLTLVAATSVAQGTTTFTVTGDTATTASHSATAQLTVTPPSTQSPTATLTAPTGGLTVSGLITVTATATVPPGTTLARIDFTADGVFLGSATQSPGSVTWDTTLVAAGAHTLMAKAVDSQGHTGTSAALAVTVQLDSMTSGGCAALGGGELFPLLGLLAFARRRRS